MKPLFVFLMITQVLFSAANAAYYKPYQPSPAICAQNPYLSQCNGTREQCEKNPYLSQCDGTKVQCEMNPYLSQCNGTPAQCERNPYLPDCQVVTQPPVDAGIDRLCRDNGYSR